MSSKKLYKEESFFETLWKFTPGIIHILSIVALVIVIFNFAQGLIGTEEFNSDNFDFVAESPLQREYNYQVGDSESNVTYVIFDDYQCPACRAFNDTKNEIVGLYSDRVNIVRKHNPLSIHANAPVAGRAVQAAHNQGKFEEFSDRIFENQDQLSVSFLEDIASGMDLDFDQWEDDWESREIRKQVEQDQDDLDEIFLLESSVTGRTKPAGTGAGTPTNIVLVDNEVYDWWSGGQSVSAISAILDNALEGVEREDVE